MGEGRYDEVARPLNAALILVCLMGVPLAILAFVYADALVPLYTTDANVVANAVPYLRARVLAVPAVGMNFAFRGFWNAIQQPQVYMNTLIVMHTVNFTLSLILTFVGVPQLGVPPLGALGAGLGTSFSIWCGTAMYMYQGVKRATKLGFLQKRPTMTDLRVLATQALPTSVTNLLYASGMMTLYSIVGTPRHDGSGGGERAHQSDVILDLAVHGHGSRRRRAERSSARSRGRGRRQAVAVGRRENHRSFDVRRRLRPRDVSSSGFGGIFDGSTRGGHRGDPASHDGSHRVRRRRQPDDAKRSPGRRRRQARGAREHPESMGTIFTLRLPRRRGVRPKLSPSSGLCTSPTDSSKAWCTRTFGEAARGRKSSSRSRRAPAHHDRDDDDDDDDE